MEAKFRPSREFGKYDYEEIEKLVEKGRILRAQAMNEFIARLAGWLKTSWRQLASRIAVKRHRPHIARI